MTPRILVQRGGGAEYWSSPRMSVLAAKDVRTQSATNVALMLVHEATHARIEQFGIGWWPGLFERIEAVCVKQEIRFCLALERAGYDAKDRIAWYRKALEHGTWLAESRYVHRVRAARARQFPRWVVWLFEHVGRPSGVPVPPA
jgi:hypothetical protein